MLNIIIGKARTDKSKKIYNMAYNKYLDGISCYIFVPGQSRVLAEEEYIKANNVKGIIGVSITSFGRYISEQLEGLEYMSNKKYLSEDAKKLILKNEMNKYSELFKIFKKVKDKPSFVDSVIAYLQTIKKEEINFEKILAVKQISTFLKSKLEEFVNIYTKISEEVDARFVDSVDELDIFTQNIDNSSDVNNSKEIFFNGYSNFSKKEFKAIEAMLKKGYNVTISLTLDEKCINKNEDFGIFEQAYNTYFNLLNMAKKAGIECKDQILVREKSDKEVEPDIEYLGDNIFNNFADKYDGEVNNVNINIYKNIYDEIECIAKEIHTLVFSSNARYKDFTIYTNDFVGYENAINKIFGQYDIPRFFDMGRRVKNNIISVYLKGMLELAKGIPQKMDQIIEIIKTGLTGISIDDASCFENYVKEFGIKGYMLGNEFKANNKEDSYNLVYDLNNINYIRENIYNKILGLRDSFKNSKLAIDYVRATYNHIQENNIAEIYFELYNDILSNDAKEESVSSQMLKKIYEIMDNICLVSQDSELSLDQYIDDFSFLIENIEISTIPAYIDEVNICDINKSRAGQAKYVYIIGAYENGLPGINAEDNIFRDNELDELKEIGINIKENSLTRENMSLFNIYLAINSGTKKLNFTLPASKITGEPLRPSYIIDNVKNLLNVKVLGNISDTNVVTQRIHDMSKYSEKIAFKNMLECIVNVKNLSSEEIEQAYTAYLYFLNKEYSTAEDDRGNIGLGYRDVLEYSREDNNLSQQTLDMIYKENINGSVSKLEKFSRCPFSYLVNYVLGLKEKKEYLVTNMDVGNILHIAIDSFSNILTAGNINWKELMILEKDKAFVTNNVDKIINEMFRKSYSKFENNARYIMLKAKIKKGLVKILLGIADSFNNSKFEPLGYEIKFGNGELFSPIEIKLKDGKTMLLIGKIDRVDSAKIGDNTYLRVVDYKSSNKLLTLDNIKEGLSLQLMAYMSSLLENKDKIDKSGEVVPASISYLTITSKIVNISEYEKDEIKLKKELTKMLKNRGIYIKDMEILECMDKNFTDGGSSYIDISTRSFNTKNKALEKDSFLEECKNIKETLKKIGEEITGGNVKIAPKKLNKESPCEYCAYKSVCRKSIRG